MRKKGIKAALLIGASVLWLTACGSAGNNTPVESAAAAEPETVEHANTEETAEAETPQERKGVFEAFEAVDLEGNEVNQDIFKDYDLTMINIWATFCGPCLSEMPELGELSEAYKEKGVQIIGICTDTLNYDGTANGDQIEAAKEIVEKTGAAYLHIVPEGDLAASLLPQIQVVPTTAFVDKDGKQVGAAVSGARDKESWAKLIDEMLEEMN